MKNFIITIGICVLFSILQSCEKDAGKLPNIAFKTGSGYISKDTTLPKGSSFLIGINASKAETNDVLKKMNLSKTVNSGSATSVIDNTLNGTNGDTYTYDYSATLDTASGQVSKYIFTITNRDGLVNQVAVSITGK